MIISTSNKIKMNSNALKIHARKYCSKILHSRYFITKGKISYQNPIQRVTIQLHATWFSGVSFFKASTTAMILLNIFLPKFLDS